PIVAENAHDHLVVAATVEEHGLTATALLDESGLRIAGDAAGVERPGLQLAATESQLQDAVIHGQADGVGAVTAAVELSGEHDGQSPGLVDRIASVEGDLANELLGVAEFDAQAYGVTRGVRTPLGELFRDSPFGPRQDR